MAHGAAHPITFRGMAGLLLAYLPKETLEFLGVKMVEASWDDKDDKLPTKIQALLDLSRSDESGLNDYPDEPIITVNPAESGRQLREASRISPQAVERRTQSFRAPRPPG